MKNETRKCYYKEYKYKYKCYAFQSFVGMWIGGNNKKQNKK